LEIKNKIFFIENKRWIFGSVFFAILLLLPIFTLLYKLFFVEGNSFSYLWETVLLDYTFNTFYLILLTSFFSLLFGILPAWFISNYNFKGRGFLDVALYLPLAIPSYIMAFTYSDILSFTGPIQTFLRNNFVDISEIFNQDYLQIEVLGIILALALYPYIYTASRVSFSLLGANYINISKNLGLSTFKTFIKVILPLSRPAIFSGLFLVLMEVLNEYGAVKYFGINTFTTGIFRAWFSMNDIGTAIQLSVILLLVVFFFFFIEKFYHSKTKFFYRINSKIQTLSNLKGKNQIYIILLCFIPFFLGFLVPFIFILNNVFNTFNLVDFNNLFLLTFNTVTVSSFSALLIVLIALFFLYVEKFSKNKINYFISQSISLGYAIPGAVVGLALIMLVTSINDMFSSFTLLGSFYLLVYAYIIRFLAVGKSPIKSSLEKQPDSYDDTAKNLGLGPLKLLQKIHLPINKFALITAFIVTFIDLMKELPITLILRPFNFDTLATQTYEFAVEEMIPLSSVYSLMIILIGSILLMFLKNVINKQINVS
jgi:iron(III) transport system permease protein|tara:strand:+ start:754 stop:2370 length:1617 start_codon:yes stop_codon:yes gene_type:complete